MTYSYTDFLRDNKNTSREDGCATIISVDFRNNNCVVVNPDRQRLLISIPILIADMLNNMCHINNASRLRKWPDWDKKTANECMIYPNDYFDNPKKYVIAL